MFGYAILAFAAINAATVWRFYDDKQRAITGMRRISEADLLGLAFVGGTPGAYLARHLFRHKRESSRSRPTSRSSPPFKRKSRLRFYSDVKRLLLT